MWLALGGKGLRERERKRLSGWVWGGQGLTDGFHASRPYGDVKVMLTQDCVVGVVFSFNIKRVEPSQVHNQVGHITCQ